MEIKLAYQLRVYDDDGKIMHSTDDEITVPVARCERKGIHLTDNFDREVNLEGDARFVYLRTKAQGVHEHPLAEVTLTKWPEPQKVATQQVLISIGEYSDKLVLRKGLADLVNCDIITGGN